MFTAEVWKSVEGFSGYMVSNQGRVKSLARMVDYHHRIVQRDDRILIPRIHRGYLTMALYNDCFRKDCKIHRLVADAFLQNTKNLPHVNHKDENRLNNNASNLEYCDAKYNCNYGSRNKRISISVKAYKRREHG
jgi:hypothetical protein